MTDNGSMQMPNTTEPTVNSKNGNITMNGPISDLRPHERFVHGEDDQPPRPVGVVHARAVHHRPREDEH